MAENRRSGINPLAYQGVEASSPPQFVYFDKDPTPRDYYNFRIGTFWLNRLTNTLWVLAQLNNHVATWLPFVSGGPFTDTYRTQNGDAVPDALGVINVVGAHGINTDALVVNTVTVNLDNAITLGDLAILAPFVDALRLASGDLTITAGNINLPVTAANSTSGVIMVGNLIWAHSFGIGNTFVGSVAGNTTGLTAQACVGIGAQALMSLTVGNNNSAVGAHALESVTSGIANCALGRSALQTVAVADANVAVGTEALQVATAGFNTAIGSAVAIDLTTGINNTMLGAGSAAGLLTGSNNITLGYRTAQNYVGAESNNIIIGNQGVAAESNSIHIGVVTGDAVLPTPHAKCWIAGIRGVTTDVVDAIPVLIDSTGQLGTISSSIRYKENVNDLGNASLNLYHLRPVTFNYKTDKKKTPTYGLIAEEVAEVMPGMVIRNDEGECETVKYDQLTTLLLNELQKLEKRVASLERKFNLLS